MFKQRSFISFIKRKSIISNINNRFHLNRSKHMLEIRDKEWDVLDLSDRSRIPSYRNKCLSFYRKKIRFLKINRRK